MGPRPILVALSGALLFALAPAPRAQETSPFRLALERGERALVAGDMVGARTLVRRALERDPKAREAWSLFARWAAAAGERDLEVYARHQEYRRAVAARAPRDEVGALRAALDALDPVARDLYELRGRFVERLETLAKGYEKAGRPHSAIRVHKDLLALDPERQSSRDAIERIAARPDPSLAGHAKPRDLFADVDREWIERHDAQHATWKEAARLERPNYVTVTDAGYEVLVRSGEAMEQMSAFYREFFRYGGADDSRRVSRIEVRIFKDRDEYLTLGEGPPVEWSGGHFIGHAVETYVDSSFESMVGTLFHEAAHQFVDLATNSAGWLNEGLASFFEGTRILPNGTVIMNLPAVHRLIPLARRMESGWMADAHDGISAEDPDVTPERAPSFRTVLEDDYQWGPPWYAPTWGVVYFLYNYQAPSDGRFVYRDAFHEFVDASGGKSGKTAIATFEEVVLAQPKPPYDKKDRALAGLPRDVDALNDLWRQWILELRDEVEGRSKPERPYLEWGRSAAKGGDETVAREHFERGLVARPDDLPLRVAYAELLAPKNPDRAASLLGEALGLLERGEQPDPAQVRDLERKLAKLDPQRDTLDGLRDELGAALASLADRYAAAGLDRMVMDVAWHGAVDLAIDSLVGPYESALRRVGEGLAVWELAYDEESLAGWVAPGEVFRADGSALAGAFEDYDEDAFEYRVLTLDRVTSGDFSLEAEVQAERGQVNFCGFVFGHKSAGSFHAAVLFPPRTGEGRSPTTGYVDLASWRGDGVPPRTWLHTPVEMAVPAGESTAGAWKALRVDLIGPDVDLWFDGKLVGTWHFPTREVLQGGFGLLTGRGSCRFREVRFLARSLGDPSSALERELRLEALGLDGESPVDGSYQERTPPFPDVARWASGERAGWEEGLGAPQLVCFWSIDQNERIPIDGWLRALHERWGGVGLSIVSIASAFDDARLDEYLSRHAFPGAVGLDRPSPEGGIGVAFERYSVGRFGLPRLLLVDIDGRVAWEGDPGFTLGNPPAPPYPSFLDDPLQDLVSRRRLAELGLWREAWRSEGPRILEHGDPVPVAPLLLRAVELRATDFPEVVRAAALCDALRRSCEDGAGTLASLARDGAEPAFERLVAWSAVLAPDLGPDVQRALKKLTREAAAAKSSADWRKALAALGKYARGKLDPPSLEAELAPLSGVLIDELRADLSVGAIEPEQAEAWGQAAPGRWLLRNYLGWRGGSR